ncbi:MAG: FimD/PapC N-terminal domain-containing protein, partial [Acinetobacter sp.]
MKFSNLYLCCLLGLGGGLLLPGTAVFAEEAVEFDRAFLMGENSNDIDVQRFRDGNPVSPGRYRTQIYINNAYYGPLTLDF